MKVFIVLACLGSLVVTAQETRPIPAGSELGLFADNHLIERISGSAKLYLHKPVPQEVVFITDKPWEGNTCSYYTLFQDGDIYRMYYRGSGSGSDSEVICYAESKDGIHWIRPNLGLVEFNGSKENNIIHDGVARHNLAPFKDTNPNCRADEKYKAIGGHARTGGLYAFKSADGLHWTLVQERPVFASDWEKRSGWGQPWFDSHNVAFWDTVKKEYVLYFRHFYEGKYRAVMTCSSPDLITWGQSKFLEYPDAPLEHLYTSSVIQYPRNPNFYIGFPTRFISLTAQTEPLFMSSRDGVSFKRWLDAIIPLDAPEDRDGNRSNYMWWGLLELPGNNLEYSVYANEAYYEGSASRLRRFTYRKDGFVSVRASAEGGELETKLLTFSGRRLIVNLATKEKHFRYDGGSLQVELIDEGGYPIEGFSLADCEKVQGNGVELEVKWKSGRDLSALEGTPVRVRFYLKHADLFSFQFL